VVTVVDMGGEGGFMLAAQTVGDERGEAADDETFGVDQHPLLHHVRRLLRKGCHGSVSGWDPACLAAGTAFLVAWIGGSRRQQQTPTLEVIVCMAAYRGG